MFLSASNDMDAAVISCRNTCNEKPASVNIYVSVTHEYWPRYFFSLGLFEVVLISFPGIHTSTTTISRGTSEIMIGHICCWSSCDAEFPTMQRSHYNTESCTYIYIPDQ